MTVFSFAANPFVVLPVSLRASHEDVEEAARKRVEARPQDWSAVARARTLLRDPQSRLAAELAWFIDVGAREAATLLQAMAGGEAALLPALKNQPPLSRANVAADACARLKSTALLEPLVDAYRALDVDALGRIVNDIHAAIPMDAVAPEALRGALADLAGMHAAAALEALAAQDDPAAAFAALGDPRGNELLVELGRQLAARFPAPAATEADISPEALAAAAGRFAGEPAPQAPRERAPMWEEAEDFVAAQPAPAFVAAVAPEPIVQTPQPAVAESYVAPSQPVPAQSAPAQPAATPRAAPVFGPMERPMTFSAPKRFHEKGNSEKVRLGLMAGAGVLTLTLGVWLMAGKLPDPFQGKSHPAAAVAMASPVPPPTPVAHGRHHKKTCLSIGNTRSSIAGQWCEQ
jgi:hypothetical protein